MAQGQPTYLLLASGHSAQKVIGMGAIEYHHLDTWVRLKLVDDCLQLLNCLGIDKIDRRIIESDTPIFLGVTLDLKLTQLHLKAPI